ncbi:MAG: hypothetical protein WCH74_09395 [Chloroflexota bacterium]
MPRILIVALPTTVPFGLNTTLPEPSESDAQWPTNPGVDGVPSVILRWARMV